jgi:hypothetical protein
VHKKLIWYCNGLIEPIPEYGLDFAHRSIPEFLIGETAKPIMKRYLKDFSPQEAISQIFLATKKASIMPNQHTFLYHLMSIIRLRIDAGMDCKPPFRFLDGIRSELLRREVKEWPPQVKNHLEFSPLFFSVHI